MVKLKDFRLSHKLSQDAIARKMNITLSYYSQIERGFKPASRNFMLRLKKLFPEIDINDMFFNDEVMGRVVL